MIYRLLVFNSMDLLKIVEAPVDDCFVCEVERITTVSGIITDAINDTVTASPIKKQI